MDAPRGASAANTGGPSTSRETGIYNAARPQTLWLRTPTLARDEVCERAPHMQKCRTRSFADSPPCRFRGRPCPAACPRFRRARNRSTLQQRPTPPPSNTSSSSTCREQALVVYSGPFRGLVETQAFPAASSACAYAATARLGRKANRVPTICFPEIATENTQHPSGRNVARGVVFLPSTPVGIESVETAGKELSGFVLLRQHCQQGTYRSALTPQGAHTCRLALIQCPALIILLRYQWTSDGWEVDPLEVPDLDQLRGCVEEDCSEASGDEGFHAWCLDDAQVFDDDVSILSHL